MTILVSPDDITYIVRSIVPDLTYTFKIIMMFLRRATKYTLFNVSSSFTRFAIKGTIALLIGSISIVLQIDLTRETSFQSVSTRITSYGNSFHLARTLRGNRTYDLLRLLGRLKIRDLTHNNRVVCTKRVMPQRVLLGRGSRRYKEYTRNYGTVLDGRKRSVDNVRTIRIVYRRDTLTGPLAMRLTPRKLHPTYIKSYGVRTIPLATVPVFDNCVIAWTMNLLINDRLKITYYTQYRRRRQRIITLKEVLITLVLAYGRTVFKVRVSPTIANAICRRRILSNEAILYNNVNSVYYVTIKNTSSYISSYNVRAVFGIVLLGLVYYKGYGYTGLVGDYGSGPRLVITLRGGRCSITLLSARKLRVISHLVKNALSVLGNRTTLIIISIRVRRDRLIKMFPHGLIGGVGTRIGILSVLRLSKLRLTIFILLYLSRLLTSRLFQLYHGSGETTRDFLLNVLTKRCGYCRDAIYSTSNGRAIEL